MPRKTLEDLEKPKAEAAPVAKEIPTYEATVVSTNDSTTRKVQLDLEVDTSVKDMGPNPYARLIHMARAVLNKADLLVLLLALVQPGLDYIPELVKNKILINK